MRRRGGWLLLIALAVVATAYIGAVRNSDGPPLDPESTQPDGAKALVELVGRLGGDIEVLEGAPGATIDAAVLLEDELPRQQADAVERWIRAGGTLVVADPNSLFTPPVGEVANDELRGGCDVPALVGVETLDVGTSLGYDVPVGGRACFSTAPGEAFVVVEALGDGTVVSLGGPAVFTNALLDEADNAVLAGSLLGGADRRTAFLRPTLVGGGDRTLVDLVDTPVRAALAQLVVVFLVVALWRGRRLGQPVDEPQPVQVQGSELTRAVARLLRNNRRPERAAAILRDRARHQLSGPLGLPLDAPVDVVVSAIVARTGLDDPEVRRAVAGEVASDAEFVDVAHLLSRIREELTHDRSARPSV